tara:strand:- start:329 stop:1000 length:672 start_codon:yes stop_codon:yes gene_type:complete
MKKHILYSFRRCPYAIRARWALRESLVKVELREVDLKNKPVDLIKNSQNKTVPLLILKNGEIIEESLDIILWTLSNSKKSDLKKYFPNNLKEEILNIIRENDQEFKFHLDRFKYASRFDEKDKDYHFYEAQNIIKNWNLLLKDKPKKNFWLVGENETIADWCIWPFVRQFKIACEHQKIDNHFDDSMIRWLNYFETNNNYKDVMNKYEIWNQSSKVSFFPLNI